MDAEFVRHRYEDGYDGVIVKNRFKLGVRHLQVLYMLVCAAVMGAMRATTATAVLAMTDHTRANDTYIQIHDWDRRIQGKIISSFFFGYALMLLPAELYLRRVGGKLVLSAALLVNGALSAAMPTIANRGGWVAVYNAQLWLGMTQACLAPANQALLARWLPPNERTVFSYLVHCGVHVGILVALPVSGLLSEARLGWELVFYAQAMMALSMAAVWGILTASTPDQHQAVGDKEKEYIKEALSYYRKRVLQVPWRHILRSRPVWAAVCAHAASNTVFIFFLVEVTDFLQIFGTSLKDSSWQAALPLACMWAAQALTAPTVEWLGRVLGASRHCDITYFRKLVNAVGAVGVVAGLAVLPSLLAWRHLALAVLSGTMGLLGFQLSGFLESYRDMSHHFAGSLLSLSSAVAGAAGALGPLLAGLLLADRGTETEAGRWRIVFLSLAGVHASCTLVYSALGSSERQAWDGGGVVKSKFGYHNGVVDTNQLELEELSDPELSSRKQGSDV